MGRLRKLAVQAEKSSACKASTTGCYNQTPYDDGRRRRLSRRRLSSCSHGNVGTRPIRRSYGLLDDNVFSLAAANGWLPPAVHKRKSSTLRQREPVFSYPTVIDYLVEQPDHSDRRPYVPTAMQRRHTNKLDNIIPSPQYHPITT